MKFSIFRRSSSDKVTTSQLKHAGKKINQQINTLVAQDKRRIFWRRAQRSFDIAQTLRLETSKFEVDGRKANGLALHYEGRQERTALLAFRTGRGLNATTLPAQVLRYTTNAPGVLERETIPVTAATARALATGTEVTFSTYGVLDASRRPPDKRHWTQRDGDLEVQLRKLSDDWIAVRLSFGSSPPGAPQPLELGGDGKLFNGLWHEMGALTQINPRRIKVEERFILDLDGELGAEAFESIFKSIPGPLHVDLAKLDDAKSQMLKQHFSTSPDK